MSRRHVLYARNENRMRALISRGLLMSRIALSLPSSSIAQITTTLFVGNRVQRHTQARKLAFLNPMVLQSADFAKGLLGY
jgi:hypothetical protein